MPKIAYESKRFSQTTLAMITMAERICQEYADQGYDLTLRQLYYQFVARDLIANRQSEYKRLGRIVNDARMCGLIDWRSIADRTRNPNVAGGFDSPADFLRTVVGSYGRDLWEDQPNYVEVWVEKEALASVVERTANRERISSFACRGYVSQSEQWRAAMRLLKKIEEGKNVVVLHLGDHDPSGIDMTRDNTDRLLSFIYAHHGRDAVGAFELRRIALNMDQVEEHGPPPNPAKLTDSRVGDYLIRYGPESWELDALPPDVLDELIATTVDEYRVQDLWDVAVQRELDDEKTLQSTIRHLDSGNEAP
jgi:hypothetical protein